MKLGELLDSMVIVNHEWYESGTRVLHLHLQGDGPLRDFEVEDYLAGNNGGGMITAHGTTERARERGERDGLGL